MCVPRIKEPIVLPPEQIIEAREKARKKGTCRMKDECRMRDETHLTLKCACGNISFHVVTQPGKPYFELVCDSCENVCARVDSYAFRINEEKEDAYAHPTE